MQDAMFDIYRFFGNELHAAEFIEGRIRISTLEACRGYEDPRRGDKGEATWEYNSGDVRGSSQDPAVRYVAERSGILLGEGSAKGEIFLSNNTTYTKIPDAFVLCFTMNNSANFAAGTFGEHGVLLKNPPALFEKITKQISKEIPLKRVAMGRVEYRERFQYSLQSDPRHIAFVKTPDQYADQVEYRMLWVPRSDAGITPLIVNCGPIRSISKRT